MKSLMIVSALVALAVTVSACDRSASGPPAPDSEAVDMNAPVAEDPNAIPIDDAATNATSTASTGGAVPLDDSTLPSTKRSSEESVQPDSETLFF